MEITPERLFAIIGNLYTELVVIRAEVERLRAELNSTRGEKGTDTVTPLRPPA